MTLDELETLERIAIAARTDAIVCLSDRQRIARLYDVCYRLTQAAAASHHWVAEHRGDQSNIDDRANELLDGIARLSIEARIESDG